ncbi:TPA: AfaD family invasin [Providencia alcalifaciens]
MTFKYLILFFSVIIIGTVNATELNIEPRRGSNGVVLDGDIIATGKVSCTENNTVVDIWMDNAIIGMNAYIIKGQRNSINELRVRLEGEGWSFNRRESRGLTKLQPGKVEPFNIVADGSQKLKADTYTITINSSCTLSENIER